MTKTEMAQRMNDIQHEIGLLAEAVAGDAAGIAYDGLSKQEVKFVYVSLKNCVAILENADGLVDPKRPKE